MTITQNAGGGDWLDLPTRPVQYRSAAKHVGLPWDQINADYLANNGTIDPTVWPVVRGKVTVIGQHIKHRNGLHTVLEVDDQYYDDSNTLANAVPAKPRVTNTVLGDEQQKKACLKYRRGATIQQVADAFGVSTTAIRTALRNNNEQVRPRGGDHGRRGS